MAYRPSFAGFERDAGSAFAGIFPASLQAAAIGSGLTLATILCAALMDENFTTDGLTLSIIPGLFFFMMVLTIVTTAFCAFYIGLVGMPLAALLGHRLGTRFGLAVSVSAALLAGVAALLVLGFRTPLGEFDWPAAMVVLAYALPAGLLYRRAVIEARSLSRFAEQPA